MKSELRHVDDTNATDIRRFSQASDHGSRIQETEANVTANYTVEELAEEHEVLEALDAAIIEDKAVQQRTRSVSKDMIVDLIPGPVQLEQKTSIKETKFESEDNSSKKSKSSQRVETSKSTSQANTATLKRQKKAKYLLYLLSAFKAFCGCNLHIRNPALHPQNLDLIRSKRR